MARRKSWFLQGQAGRKRDEQEAAAAEARRKAQGASRRWWLEKGEEALLTFLDTPWFFYYEHHMKIDGKWGNFFTCFKEMEECPLCDSGHNPSYCLAATVISHKTWVDKQGFEHSNEKLLLVLKGSAKKAVLRQVDRREGDLSLCTFLVARDDGETSVNTGDVFEFQRRLTKEQILKLKPDDVDESDDEWLAPVDYAEVLAPLDSAELYKIVGTDPPKGSSESAAHKSDESGVTSPDDSVGGGSPRSIEDLL